VPENLKAGDTIKVAGSPRVARRTCS